ncbi:hypothetical protein [Actinomyces vulturis]|uniref:hypothetical protein n=1 Tax=Actinomyces vulturis TaxID=1857645 RepID=UPI00082D2CA2|nr:hypothetical protein [Actinomyces vulturis]
MTWTYPDNEQVRCGIPFNGVLPLWHSDGTITWHASRDESIRFDELVNIGLLTWEEGATPLPSGFSERWEIAELTNNGMTLILRAVDAHAQAALGDHGNGRRISLREPMTYEEAMGQEFDANSFAIHCARIMLRLARDHGVGLINLRFPREKDPAPIVSMSAASDAHGMMTFDVGTQLDVDAPEWKDAQKHGAMNMLMIQRPYSSLIDRSTQALDAAALVELAQPVVRAAIQPGFPFALGLATMLPTI